jgi:hypothetical protein
MGRGVTIGPGARFGPYEVTAQIGAGGMGDENATYGVARDGRFLMSVAASDRTPAPLAVVVNWAATLKR